MVGRRTRLQALALVFSAALPVAVAEEAYVYPLLVVAVAIVALLLPRRLPRSVVTLMVLLSAGWAASQWYLRQGVAGYPVLAVAHLMMLLCLCKLVDLAGRRDLMQIVVISATLILVGAIVSGSVVYAVALMVWLVMASHLLMRLQVGLSVSERSQPLQPTASCQRGPATRRRRGKDPALLLVSLGAAGGTLAIAAVIFLLFPRVGAGMLGSLGDGAGSGLTGFSSKTVFGQIGRIKRSARPVMRVQLRLDGQPVGGPGVQFYFRGVTFNRYIRHSGRWQWARSERDRARAPVTVKLDPTGRTVPLLPRLVNRQQGKALRQDYFVERVETPYLFSVYLPVEVGSRDICEVRRWPDDQVLYLGRARLKQLRYTVVSFEDPWQGLAGAIDGRAARWRLRSDSWRRLGKLLGAGLPGPARRAGSYRPAVSERIERLTEQVLVGLADPQAPANRYAVARTISRYLRSGEFSYTLDASGQDPRLEPIEQFLLRRKRGHCEHFASAMAVMCQLAFGPAGYDDVRLVNGFLGGQYNELGGFYLVRQSDAHSWVEINVPGRGWVRFDPTPLAGRARAGSAWWGGLDRLLHFVQFKWASLVVSYDADQRRSLLGKFEDWVAARDDKARTRLQRIWRIGKAFLLGPPGLTPGGRVLHWLVLALAGLIGALVVRIFQRLVVAGWRRLPGRRRWRRQLCSQARFYGALLDALAERGLTKPPDQTPLQFAAAVADRQPGLKPVVDIVQAFYAVQYGGLALDRWQRRAVMRAIRTIRRRGCLAPQDFCAASIVSGREILLTPARRRF